MKVLARQQRGKKTDYYTGTVIGRQTFEREIMTIFDRPAKTYKEDKLLVRMSNGEKIKVWESEVFHVVREKQT